VPLGGLTESFDAVSVAVFTMLFLL